MSIVEAAYFKAEEAEGAVVGASFVHAYTIILYQLHADKRCTSVSTSIRHRKGAPANLKTRRDSVVVADLDPESERFRLSSVLVLVFTFGIIFMMALSMAT